jgi:hypothetical protein
MTSRDLQPEGQSSWCDCYSSTSPLRFYSKAWYFSFVVEVKGIE